VALTLVVLAGAGVMIVSLARLLGVDSGLDPEERADDADVVAAGEYVLRTSGEESRNATRVRCYLKRSSKA
jgi:hypothetical protein